jgi:hypothetical protein
MDVSAAFLYGPLTEDIYVRPPDGVEDPEGRNRVWKLRKALYGLKQAPRHWNSKLHEVLTSEGFSQSPFEAALYTLRYQGESLFLLDFVDDMLLVSKSKELVDWCKQMLSQHFEMTDLGPVKKYLGWHVRRDRSTRTMWLSNEVKIRETVRTFGLEGASPFVTPLPSDFQAWLPHEVEEARGDPPDPRDAVSPLLDRRGHHQ